jgi:hypothetical protein
MKISVEMENKLHHFSKKEEKIYLLKIGTNKKIRQSKI